MIHFSWSFHVQVTHCWAMGVLSSQRSPKGGVPESTEPVRAEEGLMAYVAQALPFHCGCFH